MSVAFTSGALKVEMAMRGWTQHDLARESGLSYPTVNAAVNGRTVSQRTVRAIGLALALNPPSDSLKGLVERAS